MQVRWKCYHFQHQSTPSSLSLFCSAKLFKTGSQAWYCHSQSCLMLSLDLSFAFKWGNCRKLHLTVTGCGKGSLNGLSLSASQISLSVWDVNRRLRVELVRRHLNELLLLRWAEISRCCLSLSHVFLKSFRRILSGKTVDSQITKCTQILKRRVFFKSSSFWVNALIFPASWGTCFSLLCSCRFYSWTVWKCCWYRSVPSEMDYC